MIPDLHRRQIPLNIHLFRQKVSPDLRSLIVAIAEAGKDVEHAIRTIEPGRTGTTNFFGEKQLAIDVVSDNLIREHLKASHLVHSCVSEEQTTSQLLDPRGLFTVSYDPLDGSSAVDALGSIFAVYERGDLPDCQLRDPLAVVHVVYGPRTVLVYYCGKSMHGFALNGAGEFVLLRENLTMRDEATNHAPGNLRAIIDRPAHKELMNIWLQEDPTLRYSGATAPDVYHVLVKGAGIFINVRGG